MRVKVRGAADINAKEEIICQLVAPQQTNEMEFLPCNVCIFPFEVKTKQAE